MMRVLCASRSRWCVVALFCLFVAQTSSAWAQKDKDKEKESSPEAVELYAAAANAQNAGEFSFASDEWDNFLKKFPKDPLFPKAQHYSGVCHLQLKKFDKAAAAFAAVLKSHPTFEFAEDASLNLAWSQYSQASADKSQFYADAHASFAELLKKFPKGKYADQAHFFQGECLYNQGKKKEAVAAYEKVVKDHEKSSLRCDATYALGVTQEELSDYEGAGKTYDIFLKDCASSPLVTEVKMRKAETVLQAGKFADAEKQFGEVASVKDFDRADHALYRQAFCVAKQEKFPEAAALYEKLINTFKTSSYINDSTLSAGRCLYRVEKLAEAAKHFEKAVAAKTADSPEAAHWLCRIHLKNKKFSEAAALADKVLPDAKESAFLVNLKMDRADALYDLADKRDEALKAYLSLVADHGKHELASQALYNVAFASLEAKKYDDGLKHAGDFLKAYDKDRLTPDIRYIQAECQLQLAKYDEAEKLYAALLKASTDHAEADVWRVRYGLSIFLQKKYAETIATLTPLVKQLKSKDAVAEAQYLIGASHFNADKPADGIKALQASLAANPKWRQADETLLYLARCQRKQNELKEAIATIKKLIAEFPESRLLDQAHYRFGEFAYAADDFAGSITEYDTVIAKSPQSLFVPYALYGKGWALMKTKQFAPAAESFSSLLKDHGKHTLAAETHFARAMSRRQAGDAKGAIEDINEYLKSKPELTQQSDALYERGLAEVATRDNAAAAATFASLLKDNPKYAAADKVLYEMAWALKSQDKNEEALPHFTKLITEHADSPLAGEAHFHIGEGLYEKKQFEEAVKSYSLSKQKSSEGEIGEKAAYKLGWAHFQLKQYQPALGAFSDQLKANPKGALIGDASFMKAECLFRLENYKEALPAFQDAQKTGAVPERLKILVYLHGGQSAGQVKQWQDSVALLEAIPKNYPDSPYLAEAYYEMGWAKQNLGKHDDALKDYDEAATRSRDHVGARARFMSGEIHFEKKNYEDAIKQFQRVMFGFGADKAPAEVKTWQAQAGFEAARCYEVQIQGADAAKKTEMVAAAKRSYTYVVEKHPTSSFAADAKKRLEALSKL